MNRTDEIVQACNLLHGDGQIIELRVLRKKGISSGYFSDYSALAKNAEIIESIPDYSGIYITMNEVNPDLHARRANRIEMQLGRDDKTTADQDIIRRRWLLIDVDPKRLSGISSSDAEHELAIRKVDEIRTFLTGMNWPEPVRADSGNGAHLLYRINLPNDSDSTELVKNCLIALATFFNDDCDVDTSVYNAGRILKLYGTISKKGDNIPERPHRRSHILSCPDHVNEVTVSLLHHLAIMAPEPKEQKKHGMFQGSTAHIPQKKLDLARWLEKAGLSYEEKPYNEGRLFILDQCPFSSAHKDGAYAIQFFNGAVFAGCHHNSCGGGQQRWAELRAMYEGVKGKNLTIKEDKRKEPHVTTDKQKFGKTDAAMEEHAIKALRILREEDPIQYILDSFARDHEGDEVVAKCLVMSFASRTVINSNGLHVLVTGESGKGKSHAFDTMIQHIPPESRLDGRLSDKALFYAEDLEEGSAICLDDVGLSEKMQETLKGVTTSFKKPFIYRTVNTDRKGQTCIIPARCVWWVAKVEGSGDDQVWNRMLTCWIDDSIEQDDKVLERELEAACLLPAKDQDNRFEILVCHQIWKQLAQVHVVIPYSKQIRFSSSANRRNPGMLLDLIKSITCIHQFQRERTEINGTSVVYSNTQDFSKACSIYQALNGESGSQMSKLTRSESALVEAIVKSGMYEFSMKELQKLVDKPYNTVWKLLNGSSSHQSHYSGILEKCPALSFLDRTDVTDGGDTSRRQKIYTWDPERYESWATGGGCWLDREEDQDIRDNNDNDCGNCNTLQKDCEPLPHHEENHNGVISENNTENNNFLYILQQEKNVYEGPISPGSYTCEFENDAISAIPDQDHQSDIVSVIDSKLADDLYCGNENPTSAHIPKLPLSAVDPDDYSEIRGVFPGR